MFLGYCALLQETSRHTNLTAIRSPAAIMSTLFLDSLTLVLALPNWAIDGSPVRVVDVGTGAGFPGVPLKILFRAWRLTLIESVGKKARFLLDLSASLGLQSVEVINGRAEDVARETGRRETSDLCTARAVAPLATLLEYSAPFVRSEGLLLFPKSGNVTSEVEEAQAAAERLGAELQSITSVPETLGLGSGRVILSYRRSGNVPPGYPRRTGLARSRPIGA